MRVDFFGPDTEFFERGFFDPNSGDFNPDIIAANSSDIVLSNPATGWTVIITGFGFPADPENDPLSGTVQGISFMFGGTEHARISNLAWALQDLNAALMQQGEGDETLFNALLDLQPITYDSSAAVVGNPGIDLSGQSQNNTLIGSAFSDNLIGGDGDDTIRPGANDYYDFIASSGGNDVIDFAGAFGLSYYDLSYGSESAIAVLIDLPTNTGSVGKAGSGTDTLLNLLDAVGYEQGGDGVNIWGTAGNDVFSVTMADKTWLSLTGGRGSDTFNIDFGTTEETLRLSFNDASATGAVVNLSSMTIINDGHGFSDTLNVTGTGQIELQGSRFDDVFIGSDSRDVFRKRGGGDDTFDGNGGWDRVRYDRSEFTNLSVDLGSGTATGLSQHGAFTDTLTEIEEVRGSNNNDTLRGDAGDNYLEGRSGDDLIEGRDGDDSLYGQDGNDTLRGGSGSDRLNGGAGNDLLNVGSAADDGDRVYGSTGNDTIVFSDVMAGNSWVGITYDDLAGPIVVTIDGVANTGSVNKGAAGTDTLVDVARVMDQSLTDGLNIWGTTAGDTFNVSGAANSWIAIHGERGNDTYNLTLRGNIRLDLNSGWNDQADQGAVVNLATGVISNDGYGFTDSISVIPEGGALELRGTDFADLIIGGAADRESYVLRGGNDTLHAGDGGDMVRYDQGGSSGPVTVDLAAGIATGTWEGTGFTHTLTGVEAVMGTWFGDNIAGSDGEDWLLGLDGNDTLAGAGGADTLEGGDGNDLLYGGDQNDTLFAGSGNDTVYGGNGQDEAWLGDGDDLFYDNPQGGAFGRDTVFAGNGNDTIEGGNGDDAFYGGNGFDLILARLGNDLVYGGDQNDTIFGGAGNDTVDGGNGQDEVWLEDGDDLFLDNPQGGPFGNDTVFGGNGNDTIQGGNGGDQFFGGAGFDLIFGRLGNDVIYGGDQDDTIHAGDGNDTVYSGNGRDEVYLDNGDDFYQDSGQGDPYGADRAFGGNGNDTMAGNGGSDTLVGEDGNDLLFGGDQDDVLVGGSGNDTVYGGNGRDRAFLGDGDDIFFDNDQSGAFGADSISGEGGNDTLRAGGGNDTLSGGAGVDRFVFVGGQIGQDVVTDYETGEDLYFDQSLWGGGLSSAQVVAQFADDSGADVVFDFGGGNTVTLTGLASKAGLDAEVFFL